METIKTEIKINNQLFKKFNNIVKRESININNLFYAYMMDTIQKNTVPTKIKSKIRYKFNKITIDEIKTKLNDYIKKHKYKGFKSVEIYGEYANGNFNDKSILSLAAKFDDRYSTNKINICLYLEDELGVYVNICDENHLAKDEYYLKSKKIKIY